VWFGTNLLTFRSNALPLPFPLNSMVAHVTVISVNCYQTTQWRISEIIYFLCTSLVVVNIHENLAQTACMCAWARVCNLEHSQTMYN